MSVEYTCHYFVDGYVLVLYANNIIFTFAQMPIIRTDLLIYLFINAGILSFYLKSIMLRGR